MSARVLFVDHSGEMGGAELFLLDVVRHWSDPFKVLLFSDGPFRVRLSNLSIPLQVLDQGGRMAQFRRGGGLAAALKGGGGLLRMVGRVARLATEHDVVYANSQKAFVVGALAAFLARRPCIWHLHDILSREHFSSTAIRVVVQLANRLASRVVANSHATAEAFVAAGGRRSKVTVVYNGFELSADRCTADERARIRAEVGCGGAPLIGVFSRLAPWKGQHVVIDALARLPDAHVLLVGSALFGEDQYEAGLRERVAAAGLESRVHFLGFRTDVARLMQCVDIVVHSSTAPEPFGRVVVEGMLAGRPVIATAGGGVSEIIQNDSTGLLVEPGDAQALSIAIARLVADPELAQGLATAGEQSARARFDVTTVVAAIRAIVQDAHP